MALDDYLKIALKPVTHRSSGVCDVSCNRIDDKAVELLIEIVIKHHLLFRVIKLYDNNIQDGGGLAVAVNIEDSGAVCMCTIQTH